MKNNLDVHQIEQVNKINQTNNNIKQIKPQFSSKIIGVKNSYVGIYELIRKFSEKSFNNVFYAKNSNDHSKHILKITLSPISACAEVFGARVFGALFFQSVNYSYVVGENNQIWVASNQVDYIPMWEHINQIKILNKYHPKGIVKLLFYCMMLEENDLHYNNFGFSNKELVKIDFNDIFIKISVIFNFFWDTGNYGDKTNSPSLYSQRDAFPIGQDILKKISNFSLIQPCKWPHELFKNHKLSEDEQREIYYAALKFILFPEALLKEIANTSFHSSVESAKPAFVNRFLERQNKLRNVSLLDENFSKFIISSEAYKAFNEIKTEFETCHKNYPNVKFDLENFSKQFEQLKMAANNNSNENYSAYKKNRLMRSTLVCKMANNTDYYTIETNSIDDYEKILVDFKRGEPKATVVFVLILLFKDECLVEQMKQFGFDGFTLEESELFKNKIKKILNRQLDAHKKFKNGFEVIKQKIEKNSKYFISAQDIETLDNHFKEQEKSNAVLSKAMHNLICIRKAIQNIEVSKYVAFPQKIEVCFRNANNIADLFDLFKSEIISNHLSRQNETFKISFLSLLAQVRNNLQYFIYCFPINSAVKKELEDEYNLFNSAYKKLIEIEKEKKENKNSQNNNNSDQKSIEFEKEDKSIKNSDNNILKESKKRKPGKVNLEETNKVKKSKIISREITITGDAKSAENKENIVKTTVNFFQKPKDEKENSKFDLGNFSVLQSNQQPNVCFPNVCFIEQIKQNQ